ncbi:hypothetical protein C8J57DRAFT_1233231 [Mycena rebaudengoi]|nr:hypothetical protein C8J57DRAFT_1233231 [Mycena rebaudengoi]
MAERSYASSDFVGLKRGDLVAFVLCQPAKWPSTLGKFKSGKTNMDTMRNALLNGEFCGLFGLCRLNEMNVLMSSIKESLFGIASIRSIEDAGHVMLKDLQSEPAESSIPASQRRQWRDLTPRLNLERQCANWKGTVSQLSKENMQNLRKTLLDPSLGLMFWDPSTYVTPTNPPSTPVVTSASSIGNTNPRKTVQLLIADRRGTMDVLHTSQRIEVSLADLHDCNDGEWRARAAEVLQALQESLSKLEGSGPLDVPDCHDARYTEYFVKLIADEDIASAVMNPEYLIIPKDNRLHLRLDRVWLSHPAPCAESILLVHALEISLLFSHYAGTSTRVIPQAQSGCAQTTKIVAQRRLGHALPPP